MSAANVTVVETSQQQQQQPSVSGQNNDAASSSYANVVLNLKNPHEDKNDNNKENIGKDVNQTKTTTVDSYANNNNNNVQQAAAAAAAIVIVAPNKSSSANDDNEQQQQPSAAPPQQQQQQQQQQQLPSSSDHENEDDLSFIPVVSHSRKEKKIARKERTYKDKAGPSVSSNAASKSRNRPDRSENHNSDKKEHRRSKDRKIGEANNKDSAVAGANGAAGVAASVEQQSGNGEAAQKSGGIDEETESNPVKFVEAPIPKVNAWKPPVKAASWNDTFEALNFGENCIAGEGSEDCLFMNIYTTDISQPTKNLLPVLVTIYGGAFKAGTGRSIGPDFLINEDPNLVVVSFNYRLGPLGCLSFGTPEYPGDLGIKDQVMALKWVNENIHSFGGDKNKVTLYGLSSGSVSAHLHVLSPGSRGLFHRAILASGTALNPWAFRARNQLPELFKLAENNGIRTSNVTELIDYLKSVDCNVFLDPNSTLRQKRFNMTKMELMYAPVLERMVPGIPKPFLIKTLTDILSDGCRSEVDIMFGVTSHEANALLNYELENPMKAESLNELFEVALPLHSANVNLDFNSEVYKKMAHEIRQFYFKATGGSVTNNTLLEYSRMISDIRYNYGIDLAVRLHANYTSGRVYYYKFSGDTYLNYQKHNLQGKVFDFSGATHGDDSFYAFNRHQNDRLYLDVKNGTVEHSMISDMCKIYMNFIKYGNPTPANEPVNFEPVQRNKLNYLDLTNEGMVSGQVDPFGENMHFWDNLLKEFNLFN